jgi:murein tripeptide amidase MpaA
VIGVIARQHPGETWPSYLMEYFITLLIGDSPEARYLRERFVFKIVPMVNVDGVIYGNFRCDISGFDLNRQWRLPNRILHPQIWALKNIIYNITKVSPM